MQGNGNGPRAAADAVAERGERVATLPRGPAEELRVSLDEFRGHPFISLRVWSGGYPVKGKGVTVRLSEAEEVAGAIMEALALSEAGGPAARHAPPARPGRGDLPFDEFRGGTG